MNRQATWLTILSACLFASFGCAAGHHVAVTTPATTNPRQASATRPTPNDLIQPPEIQAPTPLRLPPLKRTKLANGLSVTLMPQRDLPLIEVQLQLWAGAIDDAPGKQGLSEFTMEMLRHGARERSADEISEQVDRAGATLKINSGYEISSISCSGRTTALELCLELLADLVKSPWLTESEMPEVRQHLLGEVKEARDDPATLAALHLYNKIFGDDHPGGRTMTAASVSSISRADLKHYHALFIAPGAAVLSITGDIESEPTLARVEQHFSTWATGQRPQRKVPPVVAPKGPTKLLLVDKPDLTQSFFALGHRGIRYADPQRDAVLLMNYALGGGGFSSRLMQVVRVEGGKTYGIASAFESHQDDGVFLISSFTRHAEIAQTLKLVERELSRIRTNPPDSAEIVAAKGKLAGGYVIGFRTAGQLAAALGRAELRRLPDDFVTQFAVRVFREKDTGVATAARDDIRPHELVGVIVGKADQIATALTKAGIAFETIPYTAPISARERATTK